MMTRLAFFTVFVRTRPWAQQQSSYSQVLSQGAQPAWQPSYCHAGASISSPFPAVAKSPAGWLTIFGVRSAAAAAGCSDQRADPAHHLLHIVLAVLFLSFYDFPQGSHTLPYWGPLHMRPVKSTGAVPPAALSLPLKHPSKSRCEGMPGVAMR